MSSTKYYKVVQSNIVFIVIPNLTIGLFGPNFIIIKDWTHKY